jgi:hypothetical protein
LYCPECGETRNFVKISELYDMHECFSCGALFDSRGDNIEVYYPKLQYCTDNASMIGSAAYFMVKGGLEPTSLDLDAKATVPLR